MNRYWGYDVEPEAGEYRPPASPGSVNIVRRYDRGDAHSLARQGRRDVVLVRRPVTTRRRPDQTTGPTGIPPRATQTRVAGSGDPAPHSRSLFFPRCGCKLSV